MNRADFDRFTEELARRTSEDPAVLGLVGLGSTAGTVRAPDEFSDHDVFLVVRAGEQERFRGNLSWLPSPERIVFSYRETAHGVKAIYEEGHLVELAVFDPGELSLARVNAYRVILDRERIGERLARVAAATRESPDVRSPSDEWLAGQFLTSLLVGVERDRRGERLSGGDLVKARALRYLVQLLGKRSAAASSELDELDPLRRFERAFPALGAELDAVMLEETPVAARHLLAIALREAPGWLSRAAVEAVRSRIRI